MTKPHDIIIYDRSTWMAVYVLAKKEHIEIRTKADGYPGYRVLSHAESPLGTALTYLFYMDTVTLSSMLGEIICRFRDINPDMPAKELRESVIKIMDCEHLLWHISPVFAPFIMASEKLLAAAGGGVSVPLDELGLQYRTFTSILPTIQRIAETCFDTALFASDDRTASKRYFDLQKTAPEGYPILRVQTVTHERAACGYELDWPFHDERGDDFDAQIIKNESFAMTYVDTLESSSLTDVVYFLIGRCLHDEIRMKKCKYCGRYFAVTDNFGAEYCNRLIDGSTKTCREIGSVRLYEQRILVDPIMQAYKRSYKTHNARIRYGYSTKEEFTAWSKEARAMRDKCIAGEITLDEFTAWLDSDKMR